MDRPAAPAISFAIGGRIARANIAELCERVCLLLEQSGAAVAICDVGDVDADAVTVDALARLQLVARRRGGQVRLCNASRELCELIRLMGLRVVLLG